MSSTCANPCLCCRIGFILTVKARKRHQPDRSTWRCVAHAGFGWNRAFDPALTMYDPEYDNDQTRSAVFRSHVAEMTDRLAGALPGDRAVHLVEIGCGQGTFLEELLARHRLRFVSLTGFDPAWRGTEARSEAGIRIHRQTFDHIGARVLLGEAEFVVARHTIEHILDPVHFLATIRSAISATAHSRLFLETPDIAWIVDQFQPEDLYYEHCSLFSRGAIELALRRLVSKPSPWKTSSLDSIFGWRPGLGMAPRAAHHGTITRVASLAFGSGANGSLLIGGPGSPGSRNTLRSGFGVHHRRA